MRAEETRGVLKELRVAFDDLDAVAEDLLRPPRQRQLGPVLHARRYQETREKIASMIDHLISMVSER